MPNAVSRPVITLLTAGLLAATVSAAAADEEPQPATPGRLPVTAPTVERGTGEAGPPISAIEVAPEGEAVVATGVISGQLTGDEDPLAGLCIAAWPTSVHPTEAAATDMAETGSDGMYSLEVPGDDEYTLLGWDCDDARFLYEYEWYLGGDTPDDATPVAVDAGSTATADMDLAIGGDIAGTVTRATWGDGIEGIWVEAFDATGTGTPWFGITDENGDFFLPALRDGAEYRIRFLDPEGHWTTEWFDGADTFGSADPIEAIGDTVLVGADAALLAPTGKLFPAPIAVDGGTWHVRYDHTTGPAESSFSYGRASDIPLTGDWDGNGTPTEGVYRDGKWFLLDGDGSMTSFYYGGRSGDIPVVGDWDGDGDDNVGIIRDGVWHLVYAHRGGGADKSFTYGRIGPRGSDVPLVGDWDGDGRDTIGIVRDGEWHLRHVLGGGSSHERFIYGRVGPRGDDIAVIGDWDGDGEDSVGVVRDGQWFLRNTRSAGSADIDFRFGNGSMWMLPLGGFGETTQQRVIGS